MSKYVENVNAYMTHMKIKQTFVSLKSGIDTSKLSRILTETQDITIGDMEKIATSLGHRVEYFLADDFLVSSGMNTGTTEVVFYVGEPSKEQEVFAMKLVDLIENVDEVLGARNRFIKAIME